MSDNHIVIVVSYYVVDEVKGNNLTVLFLFELLCEFLLVLIDHIVEEFLNLEEQIRWYVSLGLHLLVVLGVCLHLLVFHVFVGCRQNQLLLYEFVLGVEYLYFSLGLLGVSILVFSTFDGLN